MKGDRGSVSVLMLAVSAVLLVVTLGGAAVGQYLVAAGIAQSAADAAALAAAPVTFRPFGATGTAYQEAARFARENDSRLVSCDCNQDPSWATRRVEVRVARSVRLLVFGTRRVEAVGRAEFAPVLLLEN